MKVNILFLIFAFACLVALISACRSQPELSVTETAVILSKSPLDTSVIIPTVSPTATESSTPTQSPTPTFIPTATQTPTPALPVSIGTALPQPPAIIHGGNANRLVELARLGDGELRNMSVSDDGSRLIGHFLDGLRLYDSQTLQQVASIEGNLTPVESLHYGVSPNANFFAIVNGLEITVWNLIKGVVMRQFTLEEAPEGIEGPEFSPDEQSLILKVGRYSNPNHTFLWRVSDGVLLVDQQSHAHAFSPDGSLLALGAWYDGVIHIYQASNGQLVKTLTGPSDLSKLAFSLDGELLAASYGDSTWLWRLSDGQVLQQLYGKGGSYNGLYFSEDGQVLYSISENMRIWRVKDGKQLINLPNQSFPELSPDGLRLATNDNYETRLWDLTQQKQLLKFTGNRYDFSNDGSVLFIADQDGTRLFSTADGTLLYTFEGEIQPQLLADGQTMVTLGTQGVMLRNIQDGALIRRLPGYRATALPGGKTLVTVEDGQINLWELASGTLLQTARGPRTRSLLSNNDPFSANGQTLLLNSPFGLHLLQLDSLETQQVISGLTGLFTISPDRRLAALHTGEVIELRGLNDQVLLTSIDSGYISSLVFSPDSQMLAATDGWNQVSLWQVSDGRLLTSLVNPVSGINALAFSPDSRMLLAQGSNVSSSEHVVVWNISEGTVLYTQDYLTYANLESGYRLCHNQPFAFSPDSRFLALGGENCDTSVLSLNNWQKLQLLETGVDRMVTYDDSENAGGSMAFSRDGSLLATALQGGEVKIWRVLDRTLVHTILDHSSLTDAPGVSLAFSPDGRFLVTSGLGITHLWGAWP